MPNTSCVCPLPSCRRVFSVPDSLLGKQVRCPFCSCAFPLRAVNELAAQHQDEILDVLPGDRRQPKTAKRGNKLPKISPAWLAVILSCGLLLVIASCLGVATLWFSSPRQDNIREFADCGDVRVEVIKAEVKQLTAYSPAGHAHISKEDVLHVWVQMVGKNPNSKVPYNSWYPYSDVLLKDDRGMVYDGEHLKTEFGFRCTPEGHNSSATIYSDKPVRDVLIFSRPVPGATFLTLRLPASNIGGRGYIWLKIPREQWITKSPLLQQPQQPKTIAPPPVDTKLR